MNQFQNISQAANAGVCIANEPSDLSTIRNADCAAVIWNRKPLERFQTWIDGLEADRLPSLRVILRPEMVCDAMQKITESSGMPDNEERNLLVEDVAALSSIFADIMQAPYLRLRLDVINTNACRKFHVDNVTARLICTYRGTGTQYGFSTTGDDPTQISTVPTGAPIVLRGTAWSETPLSGMLHRSPPIEGMNETRLVLVLDPIAELEAENERRLMH